MLFFFLLVEKTNRHKNYHSDPPPLRGKPLTAVTVRRLFIVSDRDPEDQLTPLANWASQGHRTRYEYVLCVQQTGSCASRRV